MSEMQWEAGHDATTTAQYLGVGSGPTFDAWCTIAQRVWLEPGLHVFDRAALRRTLAGDCDTQAYVAVFDYDYNGGSPICRIIGREEVATTTSDTESTQTHDVNIPVFVEEKPVYIGIFYHRLGTIGTIGSNTPGCRGVVSTTERPTGGTGAAPATLKILIQATNGVDLPLTWTHNGTSIIVDGSAPSNAVYARWTSVNGVLASMGSYSGTAVGYAIPRPVDGRAFYLIRNLSVAAGNTLTFDFRDALASDGTVVITMGATDQVTVAKAGGSSYSIALPTVDGAAGVDGVNTQAGDKFDVAIGLEPNNGGIKVYWVNLSKGMGGIDTAGTYGYRNIKTDQAPATGTLSTIKGPETLYISGPATYDSLEVVNHLCAALGDSQTGTKGADETSPASLHRLGSALASIIDGRVWNAAIAGNKLLADTAASTNAIDRYLNSGLFDMVTVSGATLCFMGLGINDISGLSVVDEASAIAAAAALRAGIDYLILDNMGNGRAAIFGMTPYSDSNANQWEALAVRLTNDQYWASRNNNDSNTYVQAPWADMYSGYVNANGAYIFRAEYTDDLGLHYNDAGAAVAAPLLKAAIDGVSSYAGFRLESVILTTNDTLVGLGSDPREALRLRNPLRLR